MDNLERLELEPWYCALGAEFNVGYIRMQRAGLHRLLTEGSVSVVPKAAIASRTNEMLTTSRWLVPGPAPFRLHALPTNEALRRVDFVEGIDITYGIILDPPHDAF